LYFFFLTFATIFFYSGQKIHEIAKNENEIIQKFLIKWAYI